MVMARIPSLGSPLPSTLRGQSRADQPDDRCLVPLDNNIGDPDLSENAEDVWRDIANSHGVGGVGLKGDPHNNRTNSFVLPRRHPLLFR